MFAFGANKPLCGVCISTMRTGSMLMTCVPHVLVCCYLFYMLCELLMDIGGLVDCSDFGDVCCRPVGPLLKSSNVAQPW
jgi:hypothetical protein